MLDMGMFDQFVCGTDHVFIDFEHYRGDVDMVIQAGVVCMLNIFQSMLETQGYKLIELFCSFCILGPKLLHFGKGLENSVKLGIEAG